MSALPFLAILVLPASVGVGGALGGPWTFLAPLIMFGLVPLADLALGVDRRNPDPASEATLAARRTFRLVTWAVVPLQLAVLLGAAWAATRPDVDALAFAGLALSAGLSNGAMGITVAHELIHRTRRGERALGHLLLVTVAYQHWALEHVAGHHRHVATPHDPATSRLGESFYRFWPRTVAGTFRSALGLAWERRQRHGGSGGAPWGAMLAWVGLPALLAAAFGLVLGPLGLAFFLLQAVVAITLLELVNYVEHYGLLRRELAPGRFEVVTPVHSWNASHRLTNWFLFMLQRHSDHHANPGRRYQVLRHFELSPQLPAGYATMILLALVPPLWFRVMDRKVPAPMRELARSPSIGR